MGERTAVVAILVALALMLGALALGAHTAEVGRPAPAHEGTSVPVLGAGPPKGTITYVVERGDTLFSIARRFDTQVRVLQDLNGIDDPNRIATGEVLIVPAPAHSPPPHASARSQREDLADDQDLRILAAIIWLEARGEPFEGQVAVGAVVLNRVRSPLFPDAIPDVIFQPGQFPWSRAEVRAVDPDASCLRAARRALAGEDPTGGALFFCNPETTAEPEFCLSRPVLRRIGRHIFTL